MSYFTGRKDNRQSARDSIVSLRQQLLTLDKREEFLQKKIDEELKKAKANATANKKREFHAIFASSLWHRPLGFVADLEISSEKWPWRLCARSKLSKEN